MADTMKPCPFCGDTEVSVRLVRDGYAAYCVACHATGEAFHKAFDKEGAVELAFAAWNRRAPDPERDSLAERVRVLEESKRRDDALFALMNEVNLAKAKGPTP